MTEFHLHPSAAQLEQLQEMKLDGPLVMINFLRFNEDGGAETYAKYGAAAAPFLAKAAARVRYLGPVLATVIGPADESWDEIILVEYPSVRAFFEMTGDPAYPSALRADALVDSRLYCSQESSR